MSNIFIRIIYLLISWGCIGLVYSGNAYLDKTATILEPSMIDVLIPFSSHAVWLYLSFFLIIPICFLYAPCSKVCWMSICFVVIAIIAGGCYFFYPTYIISPIDTGTSLSSYLLTQLMTIDVPRNCCPSLHVALTVIVIWGCLNKQNRISNFLLVLWGVGICFSVLQLKRHFFIDFIAGGVLALCVGYSVQYVLNRFDPYRCKVSTKESLYD